MEQKSLKSTDVVVLQEQDLELVVKEKSLGRLITNAHELKNYVEQAIVRYDVLNYSEDTIDAARRDKALLNNAAKALNARRLELEREFMRPFAEFKDVVTDICKLITGCSENIDVLVKSVEKRAKDEKRASIEAYFNSKGFTLVNFGQIFNEKWLNKTEKLDSIRRDIDAIVAKIKEDMSALDSEGEDADTLKSHYLGSLDFGKTLEYGRTLRQNRERMRQDAERRNAEIEARKAREAADAARFAQMQAAANVPPETIAQTAAVHTPVPTADALPFDEVPLLVRAFRVKTTKENIIALGNFMNERGIDFEKINL